MKKLLYIGFLAFVSVFLIQCDAEEDLVTENALEGGLIDISSTSISYVIGSGDTYNFTLFVHQEGDVQINTINIYKSCFYAAAIPWSDPADESHTTADSVAAKFTDEILEQTIDITEFSKSHYVDAQGWDWAALREGLTTEEGGELPATEGEMEIGNYFEFRVEAVLSDGRIVQMATPVRMTFSTRYAGSYKVIAGEYYRIGVDNGGGAMWVGGEVSITSIDAITYRWEEWGILSGWTGNVLYFQIDPATNAITYPAQWAGVDQILNDQPLTTPVEDAADLSNVIPIAGPNMNTAMPDDVEGKDKLNMVHGYYTSGSGPREFYFLLEKIVN